MKNDLSIIVATLNEENNIIKLFDEIKKNLQNININWEIIFVDDSPNNNTANVINQLKNKENNISLIKRNTNTGLSSALTIGALSSNSKFVLFMDADLQHPPSKIIDLYKEINIKKLDIVSASRFLKVNMLLDKKRYRVSLLVNHILKKISKINFSDFLTGFFIINQNFFQKNYNNLSKVGFKLLLDIILSTKKTIKFSEIPFDFQKRYSGKSKLNIKVVIDFIVLLIDKLFGIVGIGKFCFKLFFVSLIALFQLGIFYLLNILVSFQISLFMSIFIVIYVNFILNNKISYYGSKKNGKSFFIGLIKFYSFCLFGLFINYTLAKGLFDNSYNPYFAVFYGAFLGSLWNNFLNSSLK